MAVVAAVVAAAIGAGMIINGASKKAKGARIAAANKRPEYNINPEEQQNLNLTGSLASQGLPDSTKQYYNQQSQRGLTSTIDGILKGGGDVNSINNSYGTYQDGLSKLAVLDDTQRLSNIQAFVAQNQRMSEQRDKAWQINQYAPYADKAAAAAKLKQDGETQIWKGIGTVGGAVSSYAGGQSQGSSIGAISGGGGGGIGGSSSGGSMDSGGGNGAVQASGNTNPDGSSNWGGVSSGMMAGFDRRYNASTGQYVNTTNWNKLSPESQSMINNMWSAPPNSQ